MCEEAPKAPRAGEPRGRGGAGRDHAGAADAEGVQAEAVDRGQRRFEPPQLRPCSATDDNDDYEEPDQSGETDEHHYRRGGRSRDAETAGLGEEVEANAVF